ncbi:ATP-binding cassette domain-containing protein [Cobetia sp. 14N.309.X.WAT.E.A4]|uniref:ABC transporter ATP-binding protein n=1 Tax=Cobetia sp. 14N.309.X.WAT.E.A4 TaxID=2998323 RepID=UPI0025B1B6EE|nr:ATP-binding cassette domain-containing protein [Cobetia sp. 14N.309.X.WAT.E.A4]MDN2654878.1 ATP-binding cassette domain-containing protein [Cobetia sp. 14N.309.X.WAT.E.A4]
MTELPGQAATATAAAGADASPSSRRGSADIDLDDALIRVEGLRFTRGEREIFSGIDLKIPRGKITAIMGPSGTGKTTLLKLIGGQLTPSAGRVDIAGHHVHALSRRELFRMRRRMGMLFQSGALFSDLSVFENVAFPLRVHTNLPEAMIRDIVLIKLESVGLRGARELMPAELSGGMTRRVALARAIALDPDLIMYDEPFAGQDPISMGVLVNLIRRLNDALGMTAVVVSHDIKETLTIADYVYVIADGKVMAQGTPQALNAEADPRVAQFIHGKPDGPVPFHYPAPDFAGDILDGREAVSGTSQRGQSA